MENKKQIEAFTETYIILNELKQYNKLPDGLKNIIEEKVNNNYKFTFDRNIPLFEQVTNTTTKNLLTYVYLNYINTDYKIDRFFKEEIDEILNEED